MVNGTTEIVFFWLGLIFASRPRTHCLPGYASLSLSTPHSESVAVATQSARNSAIRYWLGIAFAILFFGGFLVKSYRDDYVLSRDTERLLLFYKYTVPGSFNDGDEHHARYTCYKYRHKKDKLWKKLEKKYGVPVLEAHEYKALLEEQEKKAAGGEEQEEETVNLDGDGKEEEEKREAPDL